MADRIRDRTLVLRILPPPLLLTIQQKMKSKETELQQRIAAEEAAAAQAHAERNSSANNMGGGSSSFYNQNQHHSHGNGQMKESRLMDMDGVTCRPSTDGSTLWVFSCDEREYPARLVNLPCPVEIHKTHDHQMYYKCSDIGQILIVYEDQAAMDEAENSSSYRVEGYPSYYHSGLTPPMKKVIQRRFTAREHKSVAPPRSDVMEVEKELKNLIATISRDTSKAKKNHKSTTSHDDNKIIEDIIDDIVDYEPWMDDNGSRPRGIEFDEKDRICQAHPELYLDPEENANLVKQEEEERLREAEKRKEAKLKKKREKAEKEKKKKSKKNKAAAAAAAAAAADDMSLNLSLMSGGGAGDNFSKKKKKKGIAKKSGVKDEISQAAEQIAAGDDGENLEVLDGLFNFGDDDEFAGFDMS